MAFWSWITGWFTPGSPWQQANAQNLKLNAELSAYVAKMLDEFVALDQVARAARHPIGTTTDWNSSGAVTPLDTYLITLDKFPGFQAQVATGWQTTAVPPEDWARQLLINAARHEAFYYPAENPAGHQA